MGVDVCQWRECAKCRNAPFNGHFGPSVFISNVQRHFRFTPDTGNILRCGELFNDLVGHGKNLRWQIEAEGFRGFKIDHEVELGCLQHW